MKKLYSIALFLISVCSIGQNLQQYVNPFIGTGGHGHTFPGATTPFGMVQLSPDTRIDGSWDGCSGYHYSDDKIYGFSHTHLNGTGVSDFGDIMLMPTLGKPRFEPESYASSFLHDKEKASAGFYAVHLNKDDIDVRLTTSTRVGFHEYVFNRSGAANIILDLNHRDKLLKGIIKIIDNKTIEVMRESEGWARDQFVFSRIEFSKPFKINGQRYNGNLSNDYFEGTDLALSFGFDVKKGEKIYIKVSLSPTSFEGANLNMTEIGNKTFDQVLKDAQDLWNKELSAIVINETDKDKLAIFYTALYHTMMQPNIAQDLDGKYRGRDNKVHTNSGFDYYSVFSLWDTFRAAHPLYTVIQKKRTSDFINTFLKQYEQGGRLPVWELASNETDCMIGYHSVSVIADAMAKGITGFDTKLALEAAKHSAMLDHLGLEAYKKNGFISIDDDHESVSKTVEYAYDDWCISQIAAMNGDKKDYNVFATRAQYWKNLFDWKQGFIKPKKNGGWAKNFDPREVNNNYTEGNGWQYTFFVPQDIPGMIKMYGGPEKFEAKMDKMFNAPSKTTGREQVDVTGLIGQYAHGNEPSHHMAYLYNYVGKPEKTEEKVRFILDNFYKNAPDGLIGNEDCGQMSAWYVLSSLGIYAVTPGDPKWTVIKPYFKSATINMEDGSKLEISQDKKTSETIGFTPVKFEKRAVEAIVIVPVIEAESKSFKDKMKIEIFSFNEQDIYFDDYCPKVHKKPPFRKYSAPFFIDQSSNIIAYTGNHSRPSPYISAQYFKKPNDFTIKILSKYNPQYSAGGDEGLIDGIRCNENWRKGEWQGYQSQDFESVIDMQKEQNVNSISAGFLQDSRSWILMPTKVEYYISPDGKDFKLFGEANNSVDPKEEKTVIQNLTSTSKKPEKARYVKVIAKNFGVLPKWHQGAGFDAFIFVDEIDIK